MTSLPLNEETEGVEATRPLAVRPKLHNLCQEIPKQFIDIQLYTP
jgi:hypothetical protein